MKARIVLLLNLLLSLYSCGQKGQRNIDFYKDTSAYGLAKAVGIGDRDEIERLVKENPKLLEFRDPNFEIDILTLSLEVERYESFSKLIELGANPNSINPNTHRSILMESLKYYGNYRMDTRYTELLLKHGANPNYIVDRDFVDEKGHSQWATSPLIEAAKWNLDLVKLLIASGADPYRKLAQNQKTAFASAVRSGRYDIANYFIDSLKVNVHEPMLVVKQKPSNQWVTYYIQDYLVTDFIWAKMTGNTKKLERLKNDYPKMEDANQETWDFLKKLESIGVDFKKYKYHKLYFGRWEK